MEGKFILSGRNNTHKRIVQDSSETEKILGVVCADTKR
jgi:hypothetical protein